MKTFLYGYKCYQNGEEDYFEYEIYAENEKEALVQIVILHHTIVGKNKTETTQKVKSFITEKAGKDWEVDDAIDCINPLGSAGTSLYRIDFIRERKCMLKLIKQQCIAVEVIKTLKSRFESFPIDTSNNRNAPFHEAFLAAFADKLAGKVQSIPTFISLSSWMHGLNTTIGQAFFENVSHILCDGEKREFKHLKISHKQQTTISDIIIGLKNGTQKPHLRDENTSILPENKIWDKEIPNFTADIYFEDDKNIVCIELKTVKPNSGVFKVEKEKILLAKAALRNANPSKSVSYFLAFPFDPTAKTATGYDKTIYMKYSVDCTKFMAKEEILLAGEFWDYLSGEENTMEMILGIINAIAKTDFMEKYEFLNDFKHAFSQKEKYTQILTEWYLLKELEVAENLDKLTMAAKTDKSLQKILNQNVFLANGQYNINRFNLIQPFL